MGYSLKKNNMRGKIAHIALCESVEAGNICIKWQMLNDTGKAWEVYNYLVDFYFRAKGTKRLQHLDV